MKIHEGLPVICFFFQMITCDPIQIKSRKEAISSHEKIEFENKTKAVSDESPLPSFLWSSPVSLHVIYPDQVHDDISLRLAHTVDGFIDCLFKGSFLLEAKATATVSGCQGDETTYISVFSEHLPGQYMFSFNRNHTTQTENPYFNSKTTSNENDYDEDENLNDLSNRTKRDIIYEDYEYEEYYDEDIAYDSFQGKAKAVETPPSPLTIKIKMAYDTSLVNFFSSEDGARNYAIKIYEHGKEHLQNVLYSSLGTQIILELVDSPKYISKILEPTTKGKGLNIAISDKEDEPIPLIIAVSTDDTDSLMGVSYIRKACDNKKGLSIFKRRGNIMTAVITYLHEISHLFGVQHDEKEDERNKNEECTNKGIMTQIKSNFTVEQREKLGNYSTCSSTRFTKWFWKYGKTCMDPGLINIDYKCKSVVSVNSGCPKPKMIKNGIWSCSEDGVHCYPNCNEGYKLKHQSKSFIKCRKNQWNGIPEDFQCTCDFNYVPDNAEPLSCSGDSCQGTCKPGYSTPLITQTTCYEDGWSVTPESLACTSKPSCEISTPPQNGMWLCKDGDCTCKLSCAKGYHPSDRQEFSYNQGQNKWSVTLESLACIPNPSCQIPAPPPQHGIWLCKDGDCNCQLSCTSGYRPSDLQEIIYDPGQNQWSVQPSTFSCISTEPQVVLITGGVGAEQTVEIFDPVGRCNIDLPNMPFRLRWNTAHYLSNNGDVLICGMKIEDESFLCGKLVGQVFLHHSNLVERRNLHTGVVLDNKIYLLGGLLFDMTGSTSMESLTSPLATWSKENVELEEGRFGACAVATSEKTFLVIGGISGVSDDSEREPILIEKTQVVQYDSTTQTWKTLAPMLGGGRGGHSCLYLGNGLVLVAGGGLGSKSDSILSSSLIYNINTNTWSIAGNMHKKRASGAMVKTNGRVFFIGGTKTTRLNSIEEFHPGNNTWTLVEKRLKIPRAGFGAISVPKSYVGC